MRYGSVCSGIEAASLAWEPLGWPPAWFAEIDPFACAVLKHRWPHVPNLGDMTTLHERREFQDEPIDVLVGGTPCQSFSVAGLRGGLADPRGNLTLRFLDLIKERRPAYVVWENVPGILSDSSGAFFAFLDGLESLGYAVECDIIDAAHFGVPQRRRRVFCIAHNVADGRLKRTKLFVLMVAQLLTDFLLTVLAEHKRQSGCSELGSVFQAKHSADGLRRRMNLFCVPLPTQEADPTTIGALKSLVTDWGEAWLKFQPEQSASGYPSGAPRNERLSIEGALLWEPGTASDCLSTSPSWKAFLGVACGVARSSTTLTEIRPITTSVIYSCAKVLQSICESICNSIAFSDNLWNEESCGLTALREYMSYARSADRPLLTGMDGFFDWGGFERSAKVLVGNLERCLGIFRENSVALFPFSSCLRGDPPPRRTAGEGIARPIAAGSPGGSGYRNDADTADNLIEISPALRAVSNSSHRADSEAYVAIQTGCDDVASYLTSREHKGPDSNATTRLVTHTLRTEGFDASEDGTGRGTPVIPVEPFAFDWQAGGSGDTSFRGKSRSYIVRKPGKAGSLQADKVQAIAFWGVRRLMPVECERLMGMPDNYTLISYRGKPAADSNRYRALGNSMAVPCVAWIGRRIALVETQ